MSEREKLKDAISAVEKWITEVEARLNLYRTVPCNPRRRGPKTTLVLDAARKYLKTLPKTKTEWRVSHYERGETRTWRICDTEQDAMDSAGYALACGKSCVSINSYQVPV